MRAITGMSLACCAATASGFSAELQNEREVIAAEIPKKETGWEADHATGTWGGFRTRLVERGVHLYAGYMGEVLGNVSGGVRRGAVYEGLLELGLDLRTKQLGLWDNGLLRINSLYPHGSSLSSKYTGDLLTVSNIDAYDSFRLYEFWYEQSFADEKFSLRIGQLVADEEFGYTDSGGAFVNSAFGWPAFVSANARNTGPAFFVAAPGVRLKYAPADEWYLQAGVYDGDSFDDPNGNPRINRSGTRIHFAGEQGLLAMAEAGFLPNQKGETGGLPGQYKLGAWLHTAEFPSNFEPEKSYGENFGFYAVAEQMIWRESEDQGLWIFARAGFAPRDRSFFEMVTDFGIACTGPLPARDQDIAGLGFVHARISRDIRRFEQLDAALNGTQYNGFSDHESVLEAFYSFQVTKWWTVQPDFQWIFNPGGSSGASDAIVVGLRTSIVF